MGCADSGRVIFCTATGAHLVTAFARKSRIGATAVAVAPIRASFAMEALSLLILIVLLGLLPGAAWMPAT